MGAAMTILGTSMNQSPMAASAHAVADVPLMTDTARPSIATPGAYQALRMCAVECAVVIVATPTTAPLALDRVQPAQAVHTAVMIQPTPRTIAVHRSARCG